MLQNSSPLFPFKLGLKACLANDVYVPASKSQTGPCPWLSAKRGGLGIKGGFINNQYNKLCNRLGGAVVVFWGGGLAFQHWITVPHSSFCTGIGMTYWVCSEGAAVSGATAKDTRHSAVVHPALYFADCIQTCQLQQTVPFFPKALTNS